MVRKIFINFIFRKNIILQGKLNCDQFYILNKMENLTFFVFKILNLIFGQQKPVSGTLSEKAEISLPEDSLRFTS
jgi:hypothetical protein